jgi:branched-subunit amino acid aminotransferase/4-amino-4-deoxychorismate lyase
MQLVMTAGDRGRVKPSGLVAGIEPTGSASARCRPLEVVSVGVTVTAGPDLVHVLQHREPVAGAELPRHCMALQFLCTRPAAECRGVIGRCHTGAMMELNGAAATVDDLAALALVNLGHFTSMRVENGAVRGLGLHLDRLARDCRTVFHTELDPDRVRDYVRHAIGGIADPVVVRVTIYDPALTLARPGQTAVPQVLVTVRAATSAPQPPLRLQSVVYARDLPKVKHTGLFGALHQRGLAQHAGYDDVVFTDSDGAISEIATSNIAFITGDGQLVWPHAEVLPGTTMRLINQVRDEDVVTDRITVARLGRYAGVVATNAATGVRAVASIDDTGWPEHEMVATLRKQYESIPPQQI